MSDDRNLTIAAGDEIAIHAIVVDAIDAEATRFYRKFGFSQRRGSNEDDDRP
ncbi:hypothetical protein [Endothiovibrio diazotrophicus]